MRRRGGVLWCGVRAWLGCAPIQNVALLLCKNSRTHKVAAPFACCFLSHPEHHTNHSQPSPSLARACSQVVRTTTVARVLAVGRSDYATIAERFPDSARAVLHNLQALAEEVGAHRSLHTAAQHACSALNDLELPIVPDLLSGSSKI